MKGINLSSSGKRCEKAMQHSIGNQFFLLTVWTVCFDVRVCNDEHHHTHTHMHIDIVHIAQSKTLTKKRDRVGGKGRRRRRRKSRNTQAEYNRQCGSRQGKKLSSYVWLVH